MFGSNAYGWAYYGEGYAGGVPTVYNQSVSGALSFAGAQSRGVSYPLAGALSFSGATPKFLMNRSLTSAAASFTGALSKVTARRVTAAFAPTGTLLRSLTKLLAASFTPTGVVTGAKVLVRALTASALTFIGGTNLYPDPLLYPSDTQYPYGGAILFQLNRTLNGLIQTIGSLAEIPPAHANARTFTATLQPQVIFFKTSARVFLSATLSTAALVAVRSSHTVAQALFAGLRNAGSLSTGVNPGRLYPGGGGFGVPMPDSHFTRYKPTLRRQRMKV